MKLYHLFETPSMVPQNQYPKYIEDNAHKKLASMEMIQHQKGHEVVYNSGDIKIIAEDKYKEKLVLFLKEKAIGLMDLTPSRNVSRVLGKDAVQVMNVFILPEYRNQKYGILFYKVALDKLGKVFASSAAMTPSSRRIYGSFLKDPKYDVFALESYYEDDKDDFADEWRDYIGEIYLSNREPKWRRHELHIGPEGVTTGDEKLDQKAVFVIKKK